MTSKSQLASGFPLANYINELLLETLQVFSLDFKQNKDEFLTLKRIVMYLIFLSLK